MLALLIILSQQCWHSFCWQCWFLTMLKFLTILTTLTMMTMWKWVQCWQYWHLIRKGRVPKKMEKVWSFTKPPSEHFQSQAMTFRSQYAQSLVDLHTQSDLDPSKQVLYEGGGRGERRVSGGGRQRRISEVEFTKLFKDISLEVTTTHLYSLSPGMCSTSQIFRCILPWGRSNNKWQTVNPGSIWNWPRLCTPACTKNLSASKQKSSHWFCWMSGVQSKGGLDVSQELQKLSWATWSCACKAIKGSKSWLNWWGIVFWDSGLPQASKWTREHCQERKWKRLEVQGSWAEGDRAAGPGGGDAVIKVEIQIFLFTFHIMARYDVQDEAMNIFYHFSHEITKVELRRLNCTIGRIPLWLCFKPLGFSARKWSFSRVEQGRGGEEWRMQLFCFAPYAAGVFRTKYHDVWNDNCSF